jgi:hypothetical protein
MRRYYSSILTEDENIVTNQKNMNSNCTQERYAVQ